MTKQTGTREVLPACLSHRCGTGWDDEETDQISVLQLQHNLRRTDSSLHFLGVIDRLDTMALQWTRAKRQRFGETRSPLVCIGLLGWQSKDLRKIQELDAVLAS
jgi:hypothetical protein